MSMQEYRVLAAILQCKPGDGRELHAFRGKVGGAVYCSQIAAKKGILGVVFAEASHRMFLIPALVSVVASSRGL